VSGLQLTVGDKAPGFVGATACGRFFSLDAQAGRPALIVALGSLAPQAARAAFDAMTKACPAGIDVVPIAPISPHFAAAFADPAGRGALITVADAGGLETWQVDGAPGVMAIDRSGRIVALASLDGPGAPARILEQVAPLVCADAGRVCASAAPLLVVPGVISRERCQAFIDHFEASPHEQGRMASFNDAGAAHKLDESLKRRRDIELTAETPWHGEVMEVMARRCVPEIKRAFQKDVGYADRILIARYDDDGGYFKRHRDNALPHTAFREFAVSINLNTHEYQGGGLRFPEFDDNEYGAPAGGAMIFSASLLHEAAPVTQGRRYVILSFLSSTPG
jgi:predicted 2-oxoglutarate/Fe(II)-dependent dioxygenase YbiX